MIYELSATQGDMVVRQICFSEPAYNVAMMRVLAMGGTWWFTIRVRLEVPRITASAAAPQDHLTP
jgi:hypothetical protein